MFLFIRVVEHFAIFSGVVGSVLGSPSLVGAAKEGNLFGDEFPGGCRCEVTVVGWVVSQLGLVAVDCLRILVTAEGFVYSFFPWEGEVADEKKKRKNNEILAKNAGTTQKHVTAVKH